MNEQQPSGSANPYAPPVAAQSHWDPVTTAPQGAAPPTSIPKVYGVLSIIFSSIVLVFGLIGACSGMVGQSFSKLGSLGAGMGRDQAMVQSMMKHLGGIYAAIGVQSLVLAAMSGVLLAIGIGQLRYRRWACAWTVYWASAALVVVVGMVLMAVLYIGPAYEQMLREISKAAPSGTMEAFTGGFSKMLGGTSGVLTALFYGPYPVLLLIYFTRDRVRAVMTR